MRLNTNFKHRCSNRRHAGTLLTPPCLHEFSTTNIFSNRFFLPNPTTRNKRTVFCPHKKKNQELVAKIRIVAKFCIKKCYRTPYISLRKSFHYNIIIFPTHESFPKIFRRCGNKHESQMNALFPNSRSERPRFICVEDSTRKLYSKTK
jgi:hypothetical protein